MQLSEHEMTLAVRAAAKHVLATQRGRKARTDPDEAWQALTPLERFQLLEPVGDQVLPVLRALPEVEVAPGERPVFTTAQVTQAVEGVMGAGGGRFRRKVAVAARVLLVRAALDGIPPKEDLGDLDGLEIPDHVPDDL